ncbi:pectinesterase 1 [Cynara cardunculus var. scolymus]|uniref:pectinesterase 1 n=1 Tax=Cynara cardunculus var. scolymus TaxID=59895 RepID=UPI000D6309E7|nr:pectinesterase 1 [Cynara cardunculus var. scolymus]
MDTIRSFKGYGKLDPAEEQAFRRKTRKRILILILSLLLLLALIIGAVTATLLHKRNNHKDASPSSSSSAQSIKAVCSQTLYPDSCYSSISQLDQSNSTDPEHLLKLSLQVVFNSLSALSSSFPHSFIKSTTNDTLKQALQVCATLLDDALDYLRDSISTMDLKSADDKLLTLTKIEDLKTWLSTALTNQDTCLDALQEIDPSSTLLADTKSLMQNSTHYASNSLAIVSKISGILRKLNLPMHRKLLGEFPEWVSPGVRRLLQVGRPTPNVTVAADGTGDVTTIKEAMARVPKKSKTMFIIHIKEGVYLENVVLDKSFWNVMIYGDGKDKSIVSARLNFIDGIPTFSTATFAVAGRGFVAIDMGFKNTAGAEKHQAVAFRSGSDFSVLYRCSFDAFQDTLYPHSNRQFYRDCDVTGTIDFIFGNAAVVFQNCKIMPRQPLPRQFVTITAQGKKDPNQNTGISIQKCDISPFDNLTAPTYLGRPWKDFSTTVIMQSNIGSFLHPSGWISWVQGVDPPKSILYGEYLNTGAGAAVDKRVTWDGYKAILTDSEAGRFTVDSFIEGAMWLPQKNVIFESTL